MTSETALQRARSEWLDITAELHHPATDEGWHDWLNRLIGRALAALESIIPFEMAAVLQLEGDQLRVRFALGPLTNDDVRGHTLALKEHPTLRDILRERRARALSEVHHESDEGDPYDGVIDLPHGHSCMVVPLHAGDQDLGVLTFDSRKCGLYQREQVEMATVYGQIIGLAMFAARQAAESDKRRKKAEAQVQLLSERARGGTAATSALERSESKAMAHVVRAAKQVAATTTPVLIRGETGTGKEVLAHALHDWSERSEGPFVTINCAALPHDLIESELFGHVEGAFSGATRDRPGRFVVAEGGTLLLDEIGDMPADVQVKLLRVLQESEIQPVGSDRTIPVDVRVLAATHVDLEDAIENGQFREDLFWRLNVFPITVPPLRERKDDLAELADDVLQSLHKRTGRGPWTISSRSLDVMSEYDWPGNVRELVNTLERASIMTPRGELEVELMPRRRHRSHEPEWPTLESHQRVYIERVLDHTGGKIYGPEGAAALLELPPSTLQSRMKKLGVRRTE